jgi:hypothetical protein
LSEITEVTYRPLDPEPYLQALQPPFARRINGYINEAELANQLGVAVPTLRRWRRKGYGPKAIPIGRKFYYRQDAAPTFAAAQLKKAEAAGEPPRRGRGRPRHK